MKWENNNSQGQQTRNNNINGNNKQDPPSKPRIPFVIQKIGRGNQLEIEEITRMCIDVFFNEQKDATTNNNIGGDKKQVAPRKSLQLAYLQSFQKGDILARNAFKQDQLVDLIVARRVYPISDTTKVNGNQVNFIDDESQIYNVENGDYRYRTGEIIGYCEVAEKNFGLGGSFNTNGGNSGETPRPYLSNLSVVEYARQSGVGTRLLDAGEEAVLSWNAGHTEIVLQVEEDNPTAVQFYKRRGYEFVFADPTCRRFDTSGFFLKETRITKYALIKRLDDTMTNGSNGDEGESDAASSFIQRLRNSFFVQQ